VSHRWTQIKAGGPKGRPFFQPGPLALVRPKNDIDGPTGQPFGSESWCEAPVAPMEWTARPVLSSVPDDSIAGGPGWKNVWPLGPESLSAAEAEGPPELDAWPLSLSLSVSICVYLWPPTLLLLRALCASVFQNSYRTVRAGMAARIRLSSSGWTGLWIRPVIPAFSHSRWNPPAAWAVMARIGSGVSVSPSWSR